MLSDVELCPRGAARPSPCLGSSRLPLETRQRVGPSGGRAGAHPQLGLGATHLLTNKGGGGCLCARIIKAVLLLLAGGEVFDVDEKSIRGERRRREMRTRQEEGGGERGEKRRKRSGKEGNEDEGSPVAGQAVWGKLAGAGGVRDQRQVPSAGGSSPPGTRAGSPLTRCVAVCSALCRLHGAIHLGGTVPVPNPYGFPSPPLPGAVLPWAMKPWAALPAPSDRLNCACTPYPSDH